MGPIQPCRACTVAGAPFLASTLSHDACDAQRSTTGPGLRQFTAYARWIWQARIDGARDRQDLQVTRGRVTGRGQARRVHVPASAGGSERGQWGWMEGKNLGPVSAPAAPCGTAPRTAPTHPSAAQRPSVVLAQLGELGLQRRHLRRFRLRLRLLRLHAAFAASDCGVQGGPRGSAGAMRGADGGLYGRSSQRCAGQWRGAWAAWCGRNGRCR